MKKQIIYDEYQLKIRNETSFRSMILMFALTYFNALINENKVWGIPTIQALILISITALYFIIRTTKKGAYIACSDKNPIGNIIIFAVISIVGIASFIFNIVLSGVGILLIDGKLGYHVLPLILGAYFGAISLITLYKYKKDKKKNNDEE